MHENPVAVVHQSGKEGFEIAPDIRVGILLDQEGSGRVADMQCD
jgi:hypothetical protein